MHKSDCAIHNAPALPPAACDCGAVITKMLYVQIEPDGGIYSKTEDEMDPNVDPEEEFHARGIIVAFRLTFTPPPDRPTIDVMIPEQPGAPITLTVSSKDSQP